MSLEFIKMHYTALHKNLEAPKNVQCTEKKHFFGIQTFRFLVFYLFLDSNRRFFSLTAKAPLMPLLLSYKYGNDFVIILKLYIKIR